MYLTRAYLDPTSRQVRADLRSPEGLHKTVMRAFAQHTGPLLRAAEAVLHRLDHDSGDRLVLLVQSRSRPMVQGWPAGYALDARHDPDLVSLNVGENPVTRDVRAERAAIQAGQRFVFRLRANTTRKIHTKTGPDGIARHGRRVPLRGDEERLRWLTRHAEAAGFSVNPDQLRITEVAAATGRGGKTVTLAGATFEGMLLVTDAERFRAALECGIGPAKAYGFGLLSIAAAQ